MESKKPKWDGKSRVSNENYRKGWDEIFNKKRSILNTEEHFVSKEYTFKTDPNNEEYE